jgi:hypothetical protein
MDKSENEGSPDSYIKPIYIREQTRNLKKIITFEGFLKRNCAND